jgi:hypothetical protein
MFLGIFDFLAKEKLFQLEFFLETFIQIRINIDL